LKWINGAGRPLMLRGRVGDWDASRSRSDPGALSERQRRAQQVLPERRSSVISEALAARASPSSAESIANLTVGANATEAGLSADRPR